MTRQVSQAKRLAFAQDSDTFHQEKLGEEPPMISHYE